MESFLEKVDREIDARVEARLAEHGHGPRRVARPARDNTFALAVISLIAGIPISAIIMAHGANKSDLAALLVAWIAIVAINVANSLHNSRARGR